jgi:chromosome segregation ATPase
LEGYWKAIGGIEEAFNMIKMGKRFISGIQALYRSAGFTRCTKKLKKEIAGIESSIYLKLTEVGKQFSERSPKAAEVEQNNIPQLLAEIKKNQEADVRLQEQFKEEMDQLRVKQSEQEAGLPEKEKIENNRDQGLKTAMAELKAIETEIRNIEGSLSETEKRKQRASESKTMMPVPLLNQEMAKYKNRMEELNPMLEEKQKEMLPLKEAYEAIHSECSGLRHQIQHFKKEIQSKEALLNKERKILEKNRLLLEDKLQEGFYTLGSVVDQNNSWTPLLSPLHDSLVEYRKKMVPLQKQINENEAQLKTLASDRKWGWFFIGIIVFILIGTGVIFILTRHGG